MAQFKNPYIYRVQIKNFRNFLNVDVELDHKQVIIGENNVGKTNFLRAIQLVLDKDFSDNDRQLIESDFHDSLENPLDNGIEIEIILQIRGYEHNSKLVAQFEDAIVNASPATLQFTYKYFPNLDEKGNIRNYDYKIYKGRNEESAFTNEDRNYINIYVIKALRDVERELKANKNSPLYKLVKRYEIAKEDLEDISEAMQEAAKELLEFDEIVHIKKTIQERFTTLSGLQKDNEINLRVFDIDTERLLYTLQVYMGIKERPISELSLGLANILYVSLMLILLKDRTILPLIKGEKFKELLVEDKNGLLKKLYILSEKGNYILQSEIDVEILTTLYAFMDQYNYRPQSFTILAVEEPESHLHPVLQRLIYREVLHKSGTSVIFTSHSTFIASVAPLESIVHIRRVEGSSKIYSTARLNIASAERRDIERYIDAKRGEVYFGKGIILCEGITEEYIIPASAYLFGTPLDEYGIVVCNINSTNFKPYIQLLNTLHIPWVLFTDGDYYELEKVIDPKTGKDKIVKKHHIMSTGDDGHYLGNRIIEKLLVDLALIDKKDIPDDYIDQDNLFSEKGCFIGCYTLEIDMMNKVNKNGTNILKAVYKELILGSKEMQENFEDVIDGKDYWQALEKIEANVSKGRYAQRLSDKLTKELIPNYIEKGIATIIQKVKEGNE